MSDAPERLREAALRPLAAQPQARLAAASLLDPLLQVSHPGADAMIARWDAVDGRKGRALWRRALVVALVLLWAWVLVGSVDEAMRYKRAGYKGTGILPESREVVAEGLNERDRFLLFGDVSQQSRSGQMLALWNSAPDNPAYYAVYAFAYKSENEGAFPPDFLETAQRLDPDNSWFTYHAAGALARNAVKKDRQTLQARKTGAAPSWQILDEEKLNEALALFRKAGMQTAFVNRQKEFIAERVPLLPQRDQISRMASGCFLQDYFGLDTNTRDLSDAVAARAWMLGEAGDAEGFKQMLGDAGVFVKSFQGVRNPTPFDGLILKANIDRLIWNLHPAAAKLGLADEASQLGRIKLGLEQWSLAEHWLRDSPEVRESLLRYSGGNEWIANIRGTVKYPPTLPDELLKPGRMVEHLFASRACSLAVWALLGVGILAVALYRFCLPAGLLQLAQRLNALLLPVDWAWILGAGVLLPFEYATALARLTPLGGQDWGLIKGGGAVLLGANFLTMALLLLVMPVLIARWRLAQRAAALGICRGGSRLAWLAVLSALFLVPVLGMTAPPVANLDRLLALKLVLIAPLALVILSSLVRALAVKFTSQFSRAVVALTLLPAYACAMLLVMVSMLVYQTAQSGWERRDAMTAITSNGTTRYEAAMANELMAEIRGVLEL